MGRLFVRALELLGDYSVTPINLCFALPCESAEVAGRSIEELVGCGKNPFHCYLGVGRTLQKANDVWEGVVWDAIVVWEDSVS